MAGKIGGVLGMAVVVGSLMFLAAPGEAAEQECGPITLDMLFPHLDVHGQPIPTTTTTTTTPPDEDTTTTTPPEDTGSETTTTEATTTTAPTTTAPPATEPVTNPEPCRTWVYDMLWPVAVESRVFSGFGADRDGGARRHKGNDIVAPKLAPVVAVADGVISSIHNTPPDDCCWLMITHHDGWQSLYVHLNNDGYLNDDGLGHGVRPGLELGSEVKAGQVIGWNGDSGNAEGTEPHVHFELRHPDGYSVDPYSSLMAAKAKVDLPPPTGPFLDLVGEGLGNRLSALLTAGIFWPCDDVGLYFCPTRLAQPEDVAELLTQMTGLQTAPVVAGNTQLISLLHSIPRERVPDVLGCDPIEECLEEGMTAGDLARLAFWANLAMRGDPAIEIDDTPDLRRTSARTAEQGLRVMGRIGICHDVVDDTRLISRAEAVHLLGWWTLGIGQVPCGQEGSDPTS